MKNEIPFTPLDSLLWKTIHNELKEQGFQCKYDKLLVGERAIWSAPKEDVDDWGSTEFNDDWTINKKDDSVFEKREEIYIEKGKSCFELFSEFNSVYEQYTAFANGWNYSVEMVNHIEEQIDKIASELRLLKRDCPIIQEFESRRKQQSKNENTQPNIRDLFEKRKKEIEPKRSDGDWSPFKKI